MDVDLQCLLLRCSSFSPSRGSCKFAYCLVWRQVLDRLILNSFGTWWLIAGSSCWVNSLFVSSIPFPSLLVQRSPCERRNQLTRPSPASQLPKGFPQPREGTALSPTHHANLFTLSQQHIQQTSWTWDSERAQFLCRRTSLLIFNVACSASPVVLPHFGRPRLFYQPQFFVPIRFLLPEAPPVLILTTSKFQRHRVFGPLRLRQGWREFEGGRSSSRMLSCHW